MESVQVKSYGYGGLLSCVVFFSAPHPVTKGQDIFPFHSFTPSLSPSLAFVFAQVRGEQSNACGWET